MIGQAKWLFFPMAYSYMKISYYHLFKRNKLLNHDAFDIGFTYTWNNLLYNVLKYWVLKKQIPILLNERMNERIMFIPKKYFKSTSIKILNIKIGLSTYSQATKMLLYIILGLHSRLVKKLIQMIILDIIIGHKVFLLTYTKTFSK
jgi:hypothetical protein